MVHGDQGRWGLRWGQRKVLRGYGGKLRVGSNLMNGNGFSNGFPTWVKAIAQVGFPIVVAVYSLFTLYPMISQVEAQVKANGTIAQGIITGLQEQVAVLRIICRNVAKNDFDHANCDSAR